MILPGARLRALSAGVLCLRFNHTPWQLVKGYGDFSNKNVPVPNILRDFRNAPLYIHCFFSTILIQRCFLYHFLSLTKWTIICHNFDYFFCGSFMFLFCLVFSMSLCSSVYMCFVVTCWGRADLLALVCGV